MKFFLITYFLPLICFSQDNSRYDKILENENINLNKNYDTTLFLNRHLKEIVFSKDEIFNFVDINGISYEIGRLNPKRDTLQQNNNYLKSGFIYSTKKNTHYTDFIEFTFFSRPNYPLSSYFRQKPSVYFGSISKFTPPINSSFKAEVLINKETVSDTLIDNHKYFILQRKALVEYIKQEGKERNSDHRLYVNSYSIIDNNNYAITYQKSDWIIANRDSSKVFKRRIIQKYKKLGNKYINYENYLILPRYIAGHPMSYNNKGLYTVLLCKSEPFLEVGEIKKLSKISYKPYKEFCKKIERVPDEGIKIFEEAKCFVDEPLPNFGDLENYWKK